MRRIWNTAVFWTTLTASVFTIILAWQQWNKETTLEGRFPLYLLSAFVVMFLTALVSQEYRYSRKARYAEAISYLNRIYLHIQKLAANHATSSAEIKGGCLLIVNTLATTFSLLTATRCSACIKVIEGARNTGAGGQFRPKVVTLCRDETSQERESATVQVDHWIDQNTDFEELLKSSGTPQRHFFSNYLPGLRRYKNTSLKVYGDPWDINVPLIGDIIRDITWRLPYKSTVVFPISPQPDPARREYTLAGYLCIDSRSRGAFSRRYDPDLMAGVADCLYEIVHNYRQIEWKEEKSEGQ